MRHIATHNGKRPLLTTPANVPHLGTPLPMSTFLPLPLDRQTLQYPECRLPDFVHVRQMALLNAVVQFGFAQFAGIARLSKTPLLESWPCLPFGNRLKDCQPSAER